MGKQDESTEEKATFNQKTFTPYYPHHVLLFY